MNTLYKGRPQPALFDANWSIVAQEIENGPKNNAKLIANPSGQRYRQALERLSAEERGELRRFDELLFLSVAELIMRRYRDICSAEYAPVARIREKDFETIFLPKAALAIQRIVDPYAVQTLLDRRPTCHHNDIAAKRHLRITRLQAPVCTSIRNLVAHRYPNPLATFDLTEHSSASRSPARLLNMKAVGVERAVIHKLNATNWVQEAINAATMDPS